MRRALPRDLQNLGASFGGFHTLRGDYPPIIQEEDERLQLSATGWFMVQDPEATVGQ